MCSDHSGLKKGSGCASGNACGGVGCLATARVTSPSYPLVMFSLSAAANASRCPLCYLDIKPNSEDGLKLHFTRKCTANARRVGAAKK